MFMDTILEEKKGGEVDVVTALLCHKFNGRDEEPSDVILKGVKVIEEYQLSFHPISFLRKSLLDASTSLKDLEALQQAADRTARSNHRRSLFVHISILPVFVKLVEYVTLWVEHGAYSLLERSISSKCASTIQTLPFPKLFEVLNSVFGFADPMAKGATIEKGLSAAVDFVGGKGKVIEAFRNHLC
ncbi:hypothetical protein HDU79_006581 [Rhizoclosmatium sp. JEL0117]|nr:hypothetical protein HDU79_006581 [Rhizoclosmatium sp. JEL0117]